MDIRSALVLALVIRLVQCNASCHNGTKLYKYDLINRLLDDSNCKPHLPPNYHKDEPVKVSVQMSVYDMEGLRDQSMEYECTLYIRLNWTDERLDYSHLATYDYLTLTGEDIRKYWIPDLYFHHAKEARYHQVFRTNELVYIGQNGSVTYSARLTILSHCQLVLYYYPFDKQKCDITIQSYASEADDLILEWAKKYPFKVQGTEYISIIDDSTTSTFTSPYANPLGNYSTLHANLRFKRAHKKYDVMYIAPPVIFFLVAFFSFLLLDFDDLKAQIDTRLQVCTGTLVSTVMLWGGIYAKLPPVAVLAKLDLWMLAHVILIAIIIVFHLVLFLLECFVSDYKKRIQCSAIGMCVIMLVVYIFVAAFYTLDWKEG